MSTKKTPANPNRVTVILTPEHMKIVAAEARKGYRSEAAQVRMAIDFWIASFAQPAAAKGAD